MSAAARTLEGGWSLEEFSAERGEESDKPYGRGDLWVGCVHGKATVEAKLVWAEQASVDSLVKEIDRQLDLADSQLQTLNDDYHFGQRAAVCFVVPWYLASRGGDFGEQMLRELEDQAVKKKWVYAKHLSNAVVDCDDGHTYPGVMIVVRSLRCEDVK